jgi:hypothetical protein
MASVMAQKLANMPAKNNPVLNSQAFTALSPKMQQQVVAAAPEFSALTGCGVGQHIAQAASGTTLDLGSEMISGSAPAGSTGQAPAGRGSSGQWFGPSGPSNPLYAGWENTGVLNPINALKRKPYPVHILPGVQAASASGAGTLTFTPQEDFQGFLLTLPDTSAGATGYISNISVGTRLLNVNPGTLTPAEVFKETSDGRRFDFPFAKAQQQIVISFSSATDSVNWYATLLGYAPQPAHIRNAAMGPWCVQKSRMGYAGLGTTTLTPGGTATVTLTPQERFKIRRMLLNETALNFGGIVITSLTVGTLMQTSQNANFPASTFSALAIDDWIDFDVCPATVQVNVGILNTNATASAVFEGAAIGDVWYASEYGFAA